MCHVPGDVACASLDSVPISACPDHKTLLEQARHGLLLSVICVAARRSEENGMWGESGKGMSSVSVGWRGDRTHRRVRAVQDNGRGERESYSKRNDMKGDTIGTTEKDETDGMCRGLWRSGSRALEAETQYRQVKNDMVALWSW